MILRQPFVVVCVLGMLAGCSEPPKKAAEPEKPPRPVTGRHAFFQMYGSARLWAPDVQGLRLSSIRLAQVKDEPGKSGAWEATFISPSRLMSRTFTYSVIEGDGNLHKGIFSGLEESYRQQGQASPWPIQALKIDSDQAYEEAAKKSADYIKKNPDKPMFYLLEKVTRFPDVAWRVVWGESISTSNYSVYIDATTGEVLEKTR
jgi:hypothetical protein